MDVTHCEKPGCYKPTDVVVWALETEMDVTHCEKPGCYKPTDVYGSRWCAGCWYPGIDQDYTRYRAYRDDGYGSQQAMLMVGWADPPDLDDAPLLAKCSKAP